MSQHAERRFVPFAPDQMFDLVADIESYPAFLPWCQAAHIRERGEGWLVADLTIGAKAFQDSFASRVTLTRPHEIRVEGLPGPLSRLATLWRFEAAKGGCFVGFEIDFHIRSKLLSCVMDLAFEKAFAKMGQAFEERAAKIYRDKK